MCLIVHISNQVYQIVYLIFFDCSSNYEFILLQCKLCVVVSHVRSMYTPQTHTCALVGPKWSFSTMQICVRPLVRANHIQRLSSRNIYFPRPLVSREHATSYL